MRNERLAWPDVARGLSVLLVVTHHIVRQMAAEAPASWQAATVAWSAVDEFIEPIRIPLFFFISGLLVAKSLSSGLWERRRPWVVPAYLYVLWSSLLTLRLLVPGGEGSHSFLGNLFGNLVLAGSGYWYLYALPLYYVITHATMRVPAWAVAVPLIGALLLRDPAARLAQDVSSPVMDGSSLLGSIVANAVFFWLGARYGRRIVDELTSLRPWVGWALFASYAATQATAMRFDFTAWTLPVLSFAGIAAGVTLSLRAPSNAVPARALRYVGQRTLPVYVSQFFFISVGSLAWAHLADVPLVSAAGWFAWVYPAATVAMIAVISLAFYDLAIRTRALAWLYSPPARITGDQRRTAAPAQ